MALASHAVAASVAAQAAAGAASDVILKNGTSTTGSWAAGKGGDAATRIRDPDGIVRKALLELRNLSPASVEDGKKACKQFLNYARNMSQPPA